MSTDRAAELQPGTVQVRTLRYADEERSHQTRTEALAWCAATAERYPGATHVRISVDAEPWRDSISSGVRWIGRVLAEWDEETYTEPGPLPRDLEDLRHELAVIDEERS